MNVTEQLRARWGALDARERRLVGTAAAIVAVALLWWVALSPALATLSAARAEHAKLDAQLQQMATLQNRAKALQSQPRLNRDDALRGLESAVRDGLGAGNAQIVNAGNDGATVNLRVTPASTLALWISQARGNAHAVPREVHLTRAPAATPAPGALAGKDAVPQVRWEGTLVMALPAAR